MEKLEKQNIEDIFSLTPLQEGMLFFYLRDTNSDLYFEQLSLSITGTVDPDIFEKAWNFVTADNAMLRALYRWERIKSPTQVILKEHRTNISYIDLNESKPKISAAEIKERDKKDSFDLRTVPFRITLCKVDRETYEMIISHHHILYDGWSNGVILKEFFSAYENLSTGKKLVKKQKSHFKEYIGWIRSRDASRQAKFWQEYLSGFDTPTSLSVKRMAGRDTANIVNHTAKLEKNIRAGLEEFTKKNKVTLSALLYTAFGILLQKYNNSDDIVFGTTVSGRSAKIKDIENTVGLFINTLPLRLKSKAGKRAVDLLRELNDSLQVREEYETTPLVDIKEYSPLDNNEELFDSVVVVENYPLDIGLIQGDGRLVVNSFSISEMTNYDLSVALSLSDEIEIKCIYDDELFAAGVIERMTRHFTNILNDICDRPARQVYEIDMLSAEEKKQLLFDFNKREADFPITKTIQKLFREQVEKTPENTAVVFDGEANSYRELDVMSDTAAHILLKLSVQKNEMIGIMAYKSLSMITGIIGILKSGCAYVPLNPKAPPVRSGYILKECHVNIVLTTRRLKEKVEELNVPHLEIIIIDELLKNDEQKSGIRKKQEADRKDLIHQIPSTVETQHLASQETMPVGDAYMRPNSGVGARRAVPEEQEHVESGAADFAYVIFTSGSTGKPKGVAVTHANFCPLVSWGYKELGIGPKDRTLQNLSYYFDWSVWEIFITLTTGAALYIVPDEVLINPEICFNFMTAHEITVLHITPTQYQHLIALGHRSASLRYLFLGAEKLTYDLLERSFASVSENCRVFNMYGPTEATIISAVLEIDRGVYKEYKKLTSVPIGKPVSNLDLLVLDKNLKLCPLNVTGELYIGGDGVAAGYLNNPLLTEEKFVENPYPDLHHRHLYRTGDLVRRLPEGVVEYLGRIDHQVKIRGFRIETGEIENCLLEHDGVKEAVVIDRESEKAEKYLCAYIVGIGEQGSGIRKKQIDKPVGDADMSPNSVVGARRAVPGKSPSPGSMGAEPRTAGGQGELRDYLSRRLPDYMLPSYFVFLDRIPLNPNRKVDRSALPIPELGGETKKSTPPSSNLEKKLARIWSDVLGVSVESIGLDTNFFEIGGHSLKVTMLASRIHKEFDISLKLTEIFKMPNLRGLSSYIGSAVKKKFLTIAALEKKEYYPLSPAQKRLYILQKMEKESRAYNMSGILQLKGNVDKEKFERTFRKLIEIHDSLRTSFNIFDEEPVQRVHNPADIQFKIEYYKAGIREQNIGSRDQGSGIREKQINRPVGDAYMRPNPVVGARRAVPEKIPSRGIMGAVPEKILSRGIMGDVPEEQERRRGWRQHFVPPHMESDTDERNLFDNFIRPFDLSNPPLLRVGLMAVGEQEYVLVVDMHHIISDGSSIGIFIKDFLSIYSGEVLPDLPIQYKDFTYWQDKRKGEKAIGQMEEYWLDEFAGEIPVLDLPTDANRPMIQDFSGDIVELTLETGIKKKLEDLAVKKNSTVYMILLAMFNILLAKLSGQEEIVVGIPAQGRTHSDLHPVIGMFVNTLALRNYPRGEKTIVEFIDEVKDGTLKARENQEYQFEDLVEKISLKRDAGRNPLFDVMFALQNVNVSRTEIPGLELSQREYNSGIAKFDMTFIYKPFAKNLQIAIEYSTALFKRDTIERFADYYKTIISFALKEPGKKISEIEIISGDEKNRVCEEFNHDLDDYPVKTVADLFEEQAAKTPEQNACFDNGEYMTYENLNNRANVLANIIKEL